MVRWTRAVRRGRRRWRLLGLVAAGSAAIVFAAPLAWAGRWDLCVAAEVALIDGALARDGGFEDARRRVAAWTAQNGSLVPHGRVGKQTASKEHAGWPPFAGCTALFWRARAVVASIDGVTPALIVRAAARR